MNRRAKRLRDAGGAAFLTAWMGATALVVAWRDAWWWAHTLVPGSAVALGLLVAGCVLTVMGDRVERRERRL